MIEIVLITKKYDTSVDLKSSFSISELLSNKSTGNPPNPAIPLKRPLNIPTGI